VEERALNPRPLVVVLAVVFAVAALWAATALAGIGSSTPPNSAPAGDNGGTALIKDRDAGARHDSFSARKGDGDCPNRNRGSNASAAV
jgi:hypothetical protein